MHDPITRKNEEMDQEGDKKAQATEDGVIPCVTWDLDVNPVRLPVLPRLPRIIHTGEAENDEEPRLIQVAGLDNAIIGLTQHGHVLKLTAADEAAAEQSSWEYVRGFSRVRLLREIDVLSSCPTSAKSTRYERTLRFLPRKGRTQKIPWRRRRSCISRTWVHF